MSISFDIEFDLSDIEKLKTVDNPTKARAFALLADEYLLAQRQALDKGQTPDGRSLAPYTSRYASLRRRAGRRESPPDLNVTGAMLRSQAVRVNHDGLEVSFVGRHPASRLKASKRGGPMTASRGKGAAADNATIAEANDRVRPFIGVSDMQAQKLFDRFLEIVSAVIEAG